MEKRGRGTQLLTDFSLILNVKLPVGGFTQPVTRITLEDPYYRIYQADRNTRGLHVNLLCMFYGVETARRWWGAVRRTYILREEIIIMSPLWIEMSAEALLLAVGCWSVAGKVKGQRSKVIPTLYRRQDVTKLHPDQYNGAFQRTHNLGAEAEREGRWTDLGDGW